MEQVCVCVCVCVCRGRDRQQKNGRFEVLTALSGHVTSKDTPPVIGLERNKGAPTLLKMVVGRWRQLWVCDRI